MLKIFGWRKISVTVFLVIFFLSALMIGEHVWFGGRFSGWFGKETNLNSCGGVIGFENGCEENIDCSDLELCVDCECVLLIE